MNKFLFSVVILVTLKTFAQSAPVEYACWEQNQMPGFSFEAASDNCGDGKIKQTGTISETETSEKKVVCMMPAGCVALSPGALNELRNKLGVEKASDLNKFTASQMMDAFEGTVFTPKHSMLQCEGKGKLVKDPYGKLAMVDVKCPTVNDCANGSQVLYSMSPLTPKMIPASGASVPELQAYPKVER